MYSHFLHVNNCVFVIVGNRVWKSSHHSTMELVLGVTLHRVGQELSWASQQQRGS